LQAAASVALVFGFSAAFFQLLRHDSMLALYCARTCSGTLLETQASYAAIKSSHSGTPILSAAAVAGAVVAGAVFAAGALALVAPAFEFPFSDFAQLAKTISAATQTNKQILVIIYAPWDSAPGPAEPFGESKSGGMIQEMLML